MKWKKIPKCPICGKEVASPKASAHINSKFHQDALKAQQAAPKPAPKIEAPKPAPKKEAPKPAPKKEEEAPKESFLKRFSQKIRSK